MSVVVFGSINMDLVVRSPRLPAPGETLIGSDFFTAPGGKGANQAVASAKLGAPTKMVGRVGGDVFAAALLDSLRDSGVEVGGVFTDPLQPSGVAAIAVDDRAENTIVIVPGANGQVGAHDVARLDAALDEASVLLLQLEVPLGAVTDAARLAKQRGVRVLLDPAPARDLPDELLAHVDLITPNEVEASMLVGFEIEGEADAERAATQLVRRGAKQAVVKLGGKGAYFFDGARGQMLAPFKVNAIDTVAAGDAFNGGLACALELGLPMPQALRWGMAAGALSTTKRGAQPSMPNREALMTLLESGAP